MKKLIQIRANTHAMTLTWVLNNICTNHCDYCPPFLHRGSNHNYEWERAKEFLNRLFDRYPRINCSISGGEPTVSPHLPELVKMFYDRGQPIGITTNGAKSARYFEELAPMLNFVSFSYHPSYADSKFLEKVLTASKYTSVTVRVMMDSRYWDDAVKIYNICSNLDSIATEAIRIIPEISQRHVGDDYSDEQIRWMNEHTHISIKRHLYLRENPDWKVFNDGSSYNYNDGSVDKIGNPNMLVTTGQNDFRGWACNIGIESMFIQYNGMVGKGTCTVAHNLFHINDHAQHSLPETAEICTQSSCTCGTDVDISKVPIMSADHPYVTQNVKLRSPKNEQEYELQFYDNKKLKL